MLLGFFDLFFELCLPFLSTFLIIAVFLELSSSSIPRYANLYHHCAMVLLYFSPALLRFPESFLFFCSHLVSRSRLPGAILLPVCTMPWRTLSVFLQHTSYFKTLHVLFWFPWLFLFPRQIPFLARGLQPLDPFACWYKFIPPSISCGNPWVLFCQPDLFSLSSIYLLSAPTFYLLNYLT